jgi:hypothetical protein
MKNHRKTLRINSVYLCELRASVVKISLLNAAIYPVLSIKAHSIAIKAQTTGPKSWHFHLNNETRNGLN